jgi:hypothetical protein
MVLHDGVQNPRLLEIVREGTISFVSLQDTTGDDAR